MSQQKNKSKVQNNKQPKKQKADFITRLENFTKKNRTILLFIALALFIILGLSLFQVHVSLGEDDSAYILAADKFIKGQTFPTWHGSFYPIFISLFIRLFGLKLLLLKAINFLLMFGQIIILYFAFKDKVPNYILIGSLFYFSVNAYFLIYASQTYSEALYMLLQAAAFLSFFQLNEKIKQHLPLKKTVWDWLMFGLIMFLLSITRNVGWALLITAIVYFALNKQWKEIGLSFASLLVFYIPYNLYKSIVWHIHKAGFEGQFNAMFLINPYNPAMGKETFAGFINRFLLNSKQYLSKHLFNILGYTNTTHNSTFLAILVYIAFFFTLYMIWTKRKELLFPLIYIGIGIAATFISQQVFWDQERLIMIYVPIIVILFATALHDALIKTNLKWLAFLFLLSIFLTSFFKTKKLAKQYKPVLVNVINGNKYYGLTPDWIHYLEAANAAARRLPKNAVIACRKPGIAFVYTNGREFFGIYKFIAANINNTIDQLEKESSVPGKAFFALKYDRNNKGLRKYYAFYPYFKYLRAFINNFSTRSNWALFVPDSSAEKAMITLAQKLNMKYVTSPKQLRKLVVVKTRSDYAAYPDTLLNFFKKHHIQYVIVANLRRDKSNPKKGIITTIHRYINFIVLKYPNTFIEIYRAGRPNNEPAFIFKLNYKVAVPDYFYKPQKLNHEKNHIKHISASTH